mmetsp:Transcript_11526/g.11166  ORF Transcript_11526/g.11166 Transcript_11526/m.11166 type:complete len:578 (+) Transcript_11526:116-1849(+)
MATNLPRILPWIDWEEWTVIKNDIFSNCLAQQISALECVAVWRLRGKLPHSVESTAQLLEIGINDHPNGKVSYGSSIRSENELRMQYSLAIVRSVNGLVDGSQQGYFAESIYGLAASIGLPGWFVELRHDATHNQIPSLSVLRAASKRLIEWYYSNYWLPQSKYLEMVSQSCISLPLSKYDNDESKSVTLLNTTKEQRKSRHQQLKTEKEQLPIEEATFDVLIKTSGATFITELFIPLLMNSIHTKLSSNGHRIKTSMKNRMLKKQCDLWSARLIRIQEINKNFFIILSLHLCISTLDNMGIYDVSYDQDLLSDEKISSEWKVCVNEYWLDKLLIFNMDIICGGENNKIKKEFESKKQQFSVLEVSNLVEEVKTKSLNQIQQGSCDTKDIFNHGNSKDMFGAVFQKWNKLNQIQKEKSQNIISTTLALCNIMETVRNIQNDSSRMYCKIDDTSESMGRIDDSNEDYFNDDDDEDEDSYCSIDDSYNYSDDNNDSSKLKRQKLNDNCNIQNTDGISVEDSVKKEFVKINVTRSPAIINLNKGDNWELCSEFPVWPIGVLPCNSSILHPLYLLEEMNGD